MVGQPEQQKRVLTPFSLGECLLREGLDYLAVVLLITEQVVLLLLVVSTLG